MQTNPTWNQYLDLVKQECERRFENGSSFNICASKSEIVTTIRYINKLDTLIERMPNVWGYLKFHYPADTEKRIYRLHLQPRLDWLEGLKEK